MIIFTLPMSIDFTNLLQSVIQGCTNIRTKYIMHIANHLSAVLLLGRNTLNTPVQYSSGGLSKIADLPNSVKSKNQH